MKKRKLISLLLVLGLLVTSCSGNTGYTDDSSSADSGGEVETVEKTTLLTNIYKGTALSLPEEYSINQEVEPIYDAESGNIIVFCTSSEDTVDEEGNSVYKRYNHVLTLDKDSNVVDDKIFELTNDEGVALYMNNGVLTEDCLFFIYSVYDMAAYEETFYLAKYSFADGSLTKSGDLSLLFENIDSSRGWFYISSMCVDSDGWIYLNADEEILVLDSSFAKQFSILSSNWVNSMNCSPNTGKVYISSYLDDGYGIIALNKETKSFEDTYNLGNVNANSIFFGEGYDIYYSNDDGVYAMNFPAAEDDAGTAESAESSAAPSSSESEESAPESVQLMNYANSDIYGNNFELLKVIDAETFIAANRDAVTYERTTGIYKKAPDVDLSSITILEAAYVFLDQNCQLDMINFNKAHDNVRIVMKDYSQYASETTSAYEVLARDISTGVYKPDIVLGQLSNDYIKVLRDNGLYTDLSPYMASDPEVNADNIFTGVLESFTDDGKVWGLCREMNIRVIIGNRDYLGDRTGWTTEEMLDFALTLPDGVELFEDMTQTTARSMIFGDSGYASFIDAENNTCSFDSPLFVKYLEYVKTLPTEIDYESRPEDYYDTKYLRYHNGEIVLSRERFYDLGDYPALDATFNTHDYVMIGSPVNSEADYPVVMSSTNVIMITSFCEAPDYAWEYVASAVTPDYNEKWGGYRLYDGMPVLKSVYDAVAAEYYENFYEFEIRFSGGMSWGPGDPENPKTIDDLREPGILAYFTEEDAENLKQFLDTNVGFSVSSSIADEINEIVEEEISSYASGVKSAEECAKVIQSRVSIWLSEHE